MNITDINTKLDAISRNPPDRKCVRFAWLANYEVIAAEEAAEGGIDRNKTDLTVMCHTHNRSFITKSKYLLSKSTNLSAKFCAQCHYEDNYPDPRKHSLYTIRDLVTLLRGLDNCDFLVDETIHYDENLLIDKTTDDINLTCKHCKLPQTRSVSTINYLETESRHVVCRDRKCSILRKNSKKITFLQANERIEKFNLDENTYFKFDEHCEATCIQCGQVQYITPSLGDKSACIICSDNPNDVISSIPSVERLESYVKKFSKGVYSLVITDELKHDFERMDKSTGLIFYVSNELHTEHDEPKQIDTSKSGWRAKLQRTDMQGAADAKRKYTGNKINQKFLDHDISVKINLGKSGIPDNESFIGADKKLFLKCDHHGEIIKTYNTYSIEKILNAVNKNPCIQCEPNSGYYVNYFRIKQFVESDERIRTHGAKYKIMNSQKYIENKIQLAIENGDEPATIMFDVEITPVQTLWFTAEVKMIKAKISYSGIQKGMTGLGGFIDNTSFLAKMMTLLNVKWNLNLIPERSFHGLLTDLGNPIKIDFFSEQLGLAIEVDGTQHGEKQERIKDRKKRDKKYSEQKNRDKTVDTYFENSKLKLIREKAFKKTGGGRLKALPKHQQFDAAIKLAQNIYKQVHKAGQLPEPVKKDLLMHRYNTETGCYAPKFKKLQSVYEPLGFTVLKIYLIDGEERYIIKCQNEHEQYYGYKTHYYHQQNGFKCKKCKKEGLTWSTQFGQPS